MPPPGWSTASATVPYTAMLRTTTSVTAIQVVWMRLLPRNSAAETSAVGGAIRFTTNVQNSAASTAEKTGHAMTARSFIVKLSSDARFDASPGGIGDSQSPMS